MEGWLLGHPERVWVCCRTLPAQRHKSLNCFRGTSLPYFVLGVWTTPRRHPLWDCQAVQGMAGPQFRGGMCSPSIETLTLTGPGFRSAQASALHSNSGGVSVSSLSLERRWVAQPPPLLWNSLKRALSAQPDEVWASPQDGSSRARPKAAVFIGKSVHSLS